jgi:hypothetical protein
MLWIKRNLFVAVSGLIALGQEEYKKTFPASVWPAAMGHTQPMPTVKAVVASPAPNKRQRQREKKVFRVTPPPSMLTRRM